MLVWGNCQQGFPVTVAPFWGDGRNERPRCLSYVAVLGAEMSSKVSLVAAFFAALLIPSASYAVPVTATFTADNHYAIYYGAVDGSTMTFVGRNELDAAGSPGEFNWSLPETFNFDAADGDYVYLAAWSDDVEAQGLLGQITTPAGTYYTNTADWEVAYAFSDIDDGGAAPTTAAMPVSYTHLDVYKRQRGDRACRTVPQGTRVHHCRR